MVVLAFLSVSAHAQWTSVGTGIDYEQLTITMGDGQPNKLYVSRMAAANTNCIINSMIASNRVAGARERPSAMATRRQALQVGRPAGASVGLAPLALAGLPPPRGEPSSG